MPEINFEIGDKLEIVSSEGSLTRDNPRLQLGTECEVIELDDSNENVVRISYGSDNLTWWVNKCDVGYRNKPKPIVSKQESKSTSGIWLDTAQAESDIDVGKYENLLVGFEFECADDRNGYDGLTVSDLEEELPFNHKRLIKQQVGVAQVQLEIDENPYESKNIVTNIYEDGSVGPEVVTRPISVWNLKEAKRVHTIMKDLDADFFAQGHGGLHMTFVLDHHKEYSVFDKLVARNLIQLVRRFYPELIQAFPTNGETRKTQYRAYIQRICSITGISEKYNCIHTRYDNAADIWAIEVRMPDGTDNWKDIAKQVKFWSAMIRQAAIISKHGFIRLKQKCIDRAREFYSEYEDETYFDADLDTKEFDLLLNIINPSLKHFKYDINSYTDQDKKAETRIISSLIEGKTPAEIVKIRRATKTQIHNLVG